MGWWIKTSAYPIGDGVKVYKQRGFEYYGEDIVKPYTNVK
jgi:hypothetical protein